jgi:uncharacterized protein YndB with AHSA1/START domain
MRGMRPMVPMTLADIDNAPFRIQFSLRLQAAPEAIFAEWADPARWLSWFPLMTEAAWVSPAIGTIGAEREVALRGFGRFRERMLAWEPAARLTFTMVASTSPLAIQMSEDHRLTRNADGTTQLEYTAALVPSVLGRLLAPGTRLVLSGLVRRASKNLERTLATRSAS